MTKEIFKEEEVEMIRQLPRSQYRQQDVLIWRGTTTGEFPVRSAYHLVKEKNKLQPREGSKSYRYDNIWKSI
jgi:hypothetical protein